MSTRQYMKSRLEDPNLPEGLRDAFRVALEGQTVEVGHGWYTGDRFTFLEGRGTVVDEDEVLTMSDLTLGDVTATGGSARRGSFMWVHYETGADSSTWKVSNGYSWLYLPDGSIRKL